MKLFFSIMGWWSKYVCFQAVVVGQEKCMRQTSSQAVTENEEGNQEGAKVKLSLPGALHLYRLLEFSSSPYLELVLPL